MVDQTEIAQVPPSQPVASAMVGPGSTLFYEDKGPNYLKWLLISIGCHLSLIALAFIIIFIFKLLGLNLIAFDRPKPMHDIEFQLVSAPEQKPRDPHTRNRAEHNTRSGGEKIPKMHETEPMRRAGTPSPQPQPHPQPAKPQHNVSHQQPQPRRPQSRPVAVAQPQQHQQPTQRDVPLPPRPRTTVPRRSTSKAPQIAALPNPLAPIHVPDAPQPVADTGPLVKGPVGGGSRSAGASAAGPATVPGQFSGPSGGGGRPGGSPGEGGHGQYSQHGSPGGGGGRPGIDAVAEPDFGPYLAELQRRIRRNWTPPEDKEDKTVVLVFTIARDGRLLNIRVKRSSGFEAADGAARAAVERSAPFRPLPPEYRNNSINVEFTFDYNVYTGRSGGISGH